MVTNAYKNSFNNYKTKLWTAISVMFLLLLASVTTLSYVIYNVSTQLDSSKKVYVYDLQETLRGLKIDIINAEFEAKVNILNQEVLTAQNKISSLKDSNVKADFSDVYLNSLKLKRDNMIKDYNQTLQQMTDKINQTLVQLAQKYHTPTIFNKNAIAVYTPDVVDISSQIISILKFDQIL